ncbi:MAG: amidohydrolase family protein, partial [Candidatus Cloacimonetes bacterium]|nr:amidohydrolase family protein [Candidatus Cloacimonadota bacterium]
MKKIIFTNLLNPISWEKAEYQKEIYITIEDNIITSIEKEPQCFLTTIDDMSDCVCYPGFIDLHTHIYQYDIRGSYKNNLLEWLNNYTFPEEIKVSNTDYAKCIADKMIQNLIYCGTSTACLYSTIHRNAFEIAVNKALKFGLRTIIGKVMMDMNSPAQLTEKTQQSINESIELYKTFDNITNLIEYCFTPRFALSCSFDLMQKLGQYIQNISPYVQTHLSENIDEVKSVKTYFQNAVSYTDVYNQAGILGPKTLLAHAIHLDDTELNLIKKSRSSIVHCPDSNFFLKSGTFNLNKILEYQIPFGLGS